MTLTEKYNFKVLIDQFHHPVDPHFQDEGEKDLIYSFESVALDLKASNLPLYSMIEFGSNQAYYSLLFKHILGKKHTVNIMVEPEPNNFNASIKSFEFNKVDGIFYNRGVGKKFIIKQSDITVDPITIEEILKENNLKKLSVLHADIDGAEYTLLEENNEIFDKKLVDYIFLLTHSDELHKICFEFLNKANYNLILEIPSNLKQVGYDGLLIFKS